MNAKILLIATKRHNRKKEKQLPSRAKRLLASINYIRTLPVYLCVLCSKQNLAAAGAVVAKDVPQNAIVAGVPTKVIGYKDADNVDFQG